MTISEMLDRLRELYRDEAYAARQVLEIQREINDIRNKLINSVKP